MLLLDRLPTDSPPSAVVVGVFDGVHAGHAKIISRLVKISAERELVPTVVTFADHPLLTLRPDEAPKLLTDLPAKALLLKALGVQRTVVLEFDESMASKTHTEFVRDILCEGLNAKVVLAGPDFRFGLDRQGSVETLRSAGSKIGFDVEVIELFSSPNSSEAVSSSAIRRMLSGNRVAEAAEMLGRPYSIEGVVVVGDRRGAKIGFPTANIPVARTQAWPADGVYVGRFTDSDGCRYDCAINVGRRPTFYQNAEHSTLEAHLLDFDGDLYGHQVKVEFEEFLRKEQRFSGIDALASQLRVDVANARKVLAAIG